MRHLKRRHFADTADEEAIETAAAVNTTSLEDASGAGNGRTSKHARVHRAGLCMSTKILQHDGRPSRRIRDIRVQHQTASVDPHTSGFSDTVFVADTKASSGGRLQSYEDKSMEEYVKKQLAERMGSRHDDASGDDDGKASRGNRHVSLEDIAIAEVVAPKKKEIREEPLVQTLSAVIDEVPVTNKSRQQSRQHKKTSAGGHGSTNIDRRYFPKRFK